MLQFPKIRILFISLVISFFSLATNAQLVIGEAVPSIDNIPVFFEQMPRFPGCESLEGASNNEKQTCATKKLLEFIQDNLQYPQFCKDMGLEGRVYIKFLVDTSGIVFGEYIVRAIPDNPLFRAEAMRIIELMRIKGIRWTPAKDAWGRKHLTYCVFPVRFRLGDQTKFYTDRDASVKRPYHHTCETLDTGNLVIDKNCTDQYLHQIIHQNIDKTVLKKENISSQNKDLKLALLVDPNGLILQMHAFNVLDFLATTQEIRRVVDNWKYTKDVVLKPAERRGKKVYCWYMFELDLLELSK